MKTSLLIILLLSVLSSFAQRVEKLDEDNGFMGLKILADLDTVPDFATIFKDPDIDAPTYEYAMFGSQYTYTGTQYRHFAGARIKKLFLTTVSVYITEIKLVCEFDSSIMDTLQAMYGKPNGNCMGVNDFENKKAAWSLCIWQGKNVRLILTSKRYHKDSDRTEAEVPDYMYLKFTSVEGERLPGKF